MQEKVAKVIEEIYQSKEHFVSAYAMNPKKVFSNIIGKMDVVPYDLKYMLEDFYKELTTSSPDEYEA